LVEAKGYRWEARGVGLDRAPCGLGEAGDPRPRANPLTVFLFP